MRSQLDERIYCTDNLARVTRALNDACVLCPSAADPGRKPAPQRHRVEGEHGGGDPREPTLQRAAGMEPPAHGPGPSRPSEQGPGAPATTAVMSGGAGKSSARVPRASWPLSPPGPACDWWSSSRHGTRRMTPASTDSEHSSVGIPSIRASPCRSGLALAYHPGSQTVRAEARPLPMYVRKCPRGIAPKSNACCWEVRTNAQRRFSSPPSCRICKKHANRSIYAAGAQENGSGNVTVLLAPACPENRRPWTQSVKGNLRAPHNSSYNVRKAQ
jgi:hypothetical protein